ALLDAVRGETVTHIFVTHTHRDHSPAVAPIKAATGALVLAEGPHRPARALHVGEAPRMDASNDTEFRPDRTLADGDVVTGAGWCARPRSSCSTTSSTGNAARLRSYAAWPRAKPISPRSCGRSISGSIRGSCVRPVYRCSRISRIWWLAGSSRPMVSPRSKAAIAWPVDRRSTTAGRAST